MAILSNLFTKHVLINILIVLKQLGYSYLIIFCIILLYTIFQKLYPNFLQKISETQTSFNSKLGTKNLYLKFLMIVIYAPVMEELIFRLGISKKFKNLSIALIFAILYTIIPIINGKYIFTITVLIFPLLQFLIFKFFQEKSNYFQISVLISAVYFGMIHFFNFDHDLMKSIFSYAILIIPLMIFGYTFGKLWVKLGLSNAILGHVTLNLIGFLSSSF